MFGYNKKVKMVEEKNLVLVTGSVPGAINSIIIVEKYLKIKSSPPNSVGVPSKVKPRKSRFKKGMAVHPAPTHC